MCWNVGWPQAGKVIVDPEGVHVPDHVSITVLACMSRKIASQREKILKLFDKSDVMFQIL